MRRQHAKATDEEESTVEARCGGGSGGGESSDKQGRDAGGVVSRRGTLPGVWRSGLFPRGKSTKPAR